jgi:oligopeptide/dipeptide ABC transporter ATP-binding protein
MPSALDRSDPGLAIRALSIAYRGQEGRATVLRSVDMDIGRGEVVGLVGESGSGKSTLAYAILNYLAPNAEVLGGSIRFGAIDLLETRGSDLRQLRSRSLGAVYQDPSTALNPTMRLGEQLLEAVRLSEPGLSRRAAVAGAHELLRRVRLREPAAMMERFPHQVSGGEKQRIVIAMAIAKRPSLLVFDEPTTALDATTAAEIRDLIKDIQAEHRTSVLYITHDLASVADVADRIAVMYAGGIVETGPTGEVLRAPRHPYTRALLASLPNPFAGGRRRFVAAPSGGAPVPTGCRFRPRCPFAIDACAGEVSLAPVAEDHRVACLRAAEALIWERPAGAVVPLQRFRPGRGEPLLRLRRASVVYERSAFLGRWLKAGEPSVAAVSEVDLDVEPGSTLGLVGESGCGKSSLARAIVGLLPLQGELAFAGRTVGASRDGAFRRDVQIVFQHPDQALNPRMRIGDSLKRPLRLYGSDRTVPPDRAVAAMLERVHLPADYARRYPHQLSGGEKQRVAIARAFAGKPKLVICDEITSGLDVSVQAAIINLLSDLQDELGTAYLFITHDLNLVQKIADRVAVMHLGQVVEDRPADTRLEPPFHPYSEALLSAAPVADSHVRVRRVRLAGPPVRPRQGCSFHPRCPRKLGGICETAPPPSRGPGPGHRIACHIPTHDLARVPPIWTRAEEPDDGRGLGNA